MKFKLQLSISNPYRMSFDESFYLKFPSLYTVFLGMGGGPEKGSGGGRHILIKNK
jgi:hypothetical protein